MRWCKRYAVSLSAEPSALQASLEARPEVEREGPAVRQRIDGTRRVELEDEARSGHTDAGTDAAQHRTRQRWRRKAPELSGVGEDEAFDRQRTRLHALVEDPRNRK